MNLKASALLLSAFVVACSSPQKTEKAESKSKVQEIVDEAIAFHGMEGLNDAEFSLTFRNIDYTYTNHKGIFEYTRTQIDSIGQTVFDVMNNNGLVRLTNGDTTDLTEENRAAYTRSVNSVIYFFRLPFGLNDAAVNKTYVGEKEMKGKTYYEVKVTFAQEGGGEDFDDVFLYWFDKEDYSMDYLAYLYHTDGGGMRFREAINARRVNGVLIQDYVNLKPEDERMDIMNIAELYNAGELEVLSEIINEDVKFTLN
ncbi:hypothetical protein EV198_3026 [Roseivirga ehrenbergii]|uniref:DUF6503 family protein n=1 Tax=Roseivirga ehrenbergii (strain DSM 102268 / JCM 13514 / KCTC 12282 / NCIMB 14502 / KMM 6017) TaxID=279360 RepID=UPI000A033D48|nr:DUF6503 family protein [Roseivirga ehrenbergii]TCL01008.1 hypothetical protein EV198_3026 [Roseivirga ehrenbergii]